MESYFDKQAKYLYDKAEEIINVYSMLKANKKGEDFEIDIPQDFKDEFFKLVDKVNVVVINTTQTNVIKSFFEKEIYFNNFTKVSLRFFGFSLNPPNLLPGPRP